MTAWPEDDVPWCPISGTFREVRQPSAIEFQTEVGPGKKRRRSTLTAIPTSMSLRPLTAAQKIDLDTFFADTLEEGTLRFTAPYPVGGTTKTWRFVDPPAAEWRAPRWYVGLSLLRLD